MLEKITCGITGGSMTGERDIYRNRKEDKYDSVSHGIYIDGINIRNLFLLLHY